MAEEVGSAAGKAVGMATLKSFMNPSIDIIKSVQGIIEVALRGAAVVSGYRWYDSHLELFRPSTSKAR